MPKELKIILLFLLSLVFIIGTCKYCKSGTRDRTRKKATTLNAKDTSFINAVALLEEGNTQSFENKIFELHNEIADEIADTYHLSAEEKVLVKEAIKEKNKDLTEQYIDDYLASVKNLKGINKKDTTISFESTTRAEKATAAISGNICSFMPMFVFPPLKSKVASIFLSSAVQDPCSNILDKVIHPFSERLVQQGIIKDFEVNRKIIEHTYSSMIAEMATAEKGLEMTDEKTKSTSYFWNIIKTSGSVKIKFSAVVKCGFDLSEKFEMNIDHANRVINVSLGQPKIFEPVINTTILEFNDRDSHVDIEVDDINKMISEASETAKNEARSKNIEQEAVQNITTLMYYMFLPFTTAGDGYELRISTDYQNNIEAKRVKD